MRVTEQLGYTSRSSAKATGRDRAINAAGLVLVAALAGMVLRSELSALSQVGLIAAAAVVVGARVGVATIVVEQRCSRTRHHCVPERAD